MKWITLQYINGYGKIMFHTCSVKGMKDIKGVMDRYNIRNEDITSLIVDGRITNLEKVRDSLK